MTDRTVDPELESKHRALWALGDYSRVAAEVVAPLGPVLVRAAGITAGDRVLDIATGDGNAAIPAARAGAQVTASDLCPQLLERGRKLADSQGVSLQWREANAEALPFDTGEFDVVMSCIGVMFVPHHQQAADELVRVCRPGGTIALICWTPEGFIGELFATMKPYVAPPPPGAQPAPLWGSPDHVGGLLGARVTELSTRRDALHVSRFGGGAEFRDFFKTLYGPTIAAHQANADRPERIAALDADLAELGDRYLRGSSVMPWEYLLITARRT